jgi:hypothetical protein
VIGTGTHERRAVEKRGPAARDVPESPATAAREGLSGS